MATRHPASYDLGQHTLQLLADQRSTIVSEPIAIELDSEEAYKLHLVLQELFVRHDPSTSRAVN
jgi:hypothetical protein